MRREEAENGLTWTEMRPVTSSSHAAALPAPSAQHDGSGRPAICRCACRAPQTGHLNTEVKSMPCEVWGLSQGCAVLEDYAFSIGHIVGGSQNCIP